MYLPTQPYESGVGRCVRGISYPGRQVQPPSVEHWASGPQMSGLHL